MPVLDQAFKFSQDLDGSKLERNPIHKESPLGPLSLLKGKWTGRGFNVIWRPDSLAGQDRFLELNLTNETITFEEIPGAIPNRGLLQPDIDMFGLHYLQQISDLNTKAGLHVEPGIWASVPKTEDPAEAPSVVRMASIPHGTTILAQGQSTLVNGPPKIEPVDITPFVIGSTPEKKISFPESNLSIPTNFRTPPADMQGITQAMVDDPNSVLVSAIKGQHFKETVVLVVSSSPTSPLTGGGTANTAFLAGSKDGPNALAAVVNAIFWIETVEHPGQPDRLQLQYTQTVLLNFKGLSWPHITVATLHKV